MRCSRPQIFLALFFSLKQILHVEFGEISTSISLCEISLCWANLSWTFWVLSASKSTQQFFRVLSGFEMHFLGVLYLKFTQAKFPCAKRIFPRLKPQLHGLKPSLSHLSFFLVYYFLFFYRSWKWIKSFENLSFWKLEVITTFKILRLCDYCW